MMETFASRKIVLVFCLFVCIVLNDLSAPVHSSSESSQTMAVEEFGDSKQDGGSSVKEAAAADSGGQERGLGVPHHHHHHPNVEDDVRVSSSSLSSSSSSSSSSRGSVPEVSDDDVEDGDKDGDGDGDGDGGEEETVQFSAAISERKTQQQPTPCRRHQRAVTFDTLTTPIGGSTSLHYNPHTATFTAPFNGLFLFSVNIHHRHSDRRPLPDDVHIVAALPDTTQTIVCSISAQTGDIPDLDSVSLNSQQENVEYRDDLNFAKWGFEDGPERNRDWSRPPRSPWKRNLETRDVEGICEGVQHLRQGQEVFVRLGNLHEGLMEGADDTGVNVDNKESVQVCDITGGLFSGSLLTRDI